LITTARRFIGKFGNYADLFNLMNEYKYAHSAMEKAEILAFVERVESSKRNAFYAHTISDSPLNNVVIEWIKNK
jgi:hypothetical protein